MELISNFSVPSVVLACLPWLWERNREHRRMKRDVLCRIMGYRWHLTPRNEHPDSDFFTAFNEIPVAFAYDKDVKNAVSDFQNSLAHGFRPSSLTPLVRALAKAAGVWDEWWTSELIENPIAPNKNATENTT